MKNELNPKFIASLKALIKGREKSNERLMVEQVTLILTIGSQDYKMRVASDCKCSAINDFIKHYSDSKVMLVNTQSTRRLQLKGRLIAGLYVYEVRTSFVTAA